MFSTQIRSAQCTSSSMSDILHNDFYCLGRISAWYMRSALSIRLMRRRGKSGSQSASQAPALCVSAPKTDVVGAFFNAQHPRRNNLRQDSCFVYFLYLVDLAAVDLLLPSSEHRPIRRPCLWCGCPSVCVFLLSWCAGNVTHIAKAMKRKLSFTGHLAPAETPRKDDQRNSDVMWRPSSNASGADLSQDDESPQPTFPTEGTSALSSPPPTMLVRQDACDTSGAPSPLLRLLPRTSSSSLEMVAHPALEAGTAQTTSCLISQDLPADFHLPSSGNEIYPFTASDYVSRSRYHFS